MAAVGERMRCRPRAVAGSGPGLKMFILGCFSGDTRSYAFVAGAVVRKLEDDLR